ncbi:hypothetical protein HGM15179_000513 [Zosterops borbonicus]|uniref:Uncharacterized protein n=1 Tax=Zosterops borbonicus TaxID=364589 RepID=A0A8K1GYV1_9PASS|nr:hypothetical protein HGM15179_000513 [Zosterops borbonicus]
MEQETWKTVSTVKPEKILHGISYQYFAKEINVMSFSLHRVKQRFRKVTELAIALSPQPVDGISNKGNFVDDNPVLLSTVQFT